MHDLPNGISQFIFALQIATCDTHNDYWDFPSINHAV